MATDVNINRRLLESVRDEPEKMLLPISGYEKETVKSLEDACEPIKDLFDEKLKRYVTIAKMNSTKPKNELSPDESACIHLYTIEWDVHEDSLYMVLNRTLRAADRNKLRPWFKYLNLFLTAFFKLPPSEHTLVWRGVREDLSTLYPKGKEFAWWALSSCTASISVLESPNYLGKSGTRTIFSIQTNSGKYIQAHSYFENEDEILLPPGIYLRVIDILNPAAGLHIIQLREIPAPYQMLAEPFDLSQIKKKLPEIKSLSHVSNLPPKEENYSTTSIAPELAEKQESHSTTSVARKPLTKQENYSTNVASKSPEKEENYSTASVGPKSPEKEESHLTTSVARKPLTKPENYSTSVAPKSPEKEENYSTAGVAPKLAEKQESHLTTNVASKLAVQPLWKKGKLTQAY